MCLSPLKFQPRKNSIQSLEFYRRTVNYFYGSEAEQVQWDSVGSLARDRVNKAVRNQTNGRVENFLKEDGTITLKPPFSLVSTAFFQVRMNNPVDVFV